MSAILTRDDVTPEELLEFSEGDRYELIDGKLVQPPMSILSDLVAAALIEILGAYCREHRLGHVLPGTAQFQCFPQAPNRVRKPDVSFIRRGRLTDAQMRRGFCRVAPDLAVEVVSPNDLFEEIEARVEDYLRAGTALLWVVSPQPRRVYVHRADGSIGQLREHQELDGESVLPGFHCPVASLFPAADETTATNGIAADSP